MPDVTIRRATPDDSPAIVRLLRLFHADHLAFDAARWTTSTPPHETYEHWIGELSRNAGDGAVIVAIADEQMVGYAIAEVEDESTRHWSPRAVYFHDLFVATTHRRLGVARRLAAAITDWSAAHHPSLQIRLMTAASNDAARSFFATLGFTPCVVEMICAPRPPA